MSRFIVLVFAIIFVLKSSDGNPVRNKHSNNITSRRVMKLFYPGFRDWSHFQHSWSFPTFPYLSSVNSLFKDEDDDIDLTKRIEMIEKSQKELEKSLENLKKLISAATKMQSCNEKTNQRPVELSIGEQTENVTDISKDQKAMSKPGSSDITNDKKESAAENTKKDEAQSASATMKGDESADAAVPTKKKDEKDGGPEKIDEEEEALAPSKNNEKRGNAPSSRNEQKDTIAPPIERNEEQPVTLAEPEKLEKSDGVEESVRSQVDISNVENVKVENLQVDADEVQSNIQETKETEELRTSVGADVVTEQNNEQINAVITTFEGLNGEEKANRESKLE